MKRNPDTLKLRDMETPAVLGYELNRQTLTPIRPAIKIRIPDPTPGAPSAEVTPTIPPDPAPGSGLMRDLATLSSGTLASLSKISDMTALDRLQSDLLVFYATKYNPTWETWMDVWKDFDAQR